MKATNLPQAQPNAIRTDEHARAKRELKGKFVPREPRDGEVLLLLSRPQVGAYEWAEYARGDLLVTPEASYVVLAVKPGFSRGGEGWKRWEQLVVARPATDEDHAAVAAQKAARAAEIQGAMDRMMGR